MASTSDMLNGIVTSVTESLKDLILSTSERDIDQILKSIHIEVPPIKEYSSSYDDVFTSSYVIIQNNTTISYYVLFQGETEGSSCHTNPILEAGASNTYSFTISEESSSNYTHPIDSVSLIPLNTVSCSTNSKNYQTNTSSAITVTFCPNEKTNYKVTISSTGSVSVSSRFF